MIGVRAPAVRLSAVERVYGAGTAEEVRALSGVSLTIAPGEFVSIEGPSGCGKTTMLNLIGLLDAPTAGAVEFDGRDIGARPDRERSNLRLSAVGFIFQRFYLLPTLTARENVELPMRAAKVARAERRQRADALLDRVGLGGRASSYPHQLSGGEEQRVAIARAFANRPGVILADEPTGELDSVNTGAILDLLDEAHKETASTIVLVTHNPLVAARAGRHLTMGDGRVVSDTGAAR